MEIKELQDKYLGLLKQVEEARAPYDGKEAPPEEVKTNMNALLDEADKLQDEIKAKQDEVKQAKRLDEHTKWANEPQRSFPFPKADSEQKDGEKEQLAVKGFRAYLKGGQMALANDAIPGIPEYKVLQADQDTAGGYLTVPMQVVQTLLQGIDDAVVIRGLANTIQVGQGVSLGVPTLDTDQEDPTWTSELQTGVQDDVGAFGRRELNPSPLAKRVRISNKLINAPGMDAEAIWLQRMQYRFDRAQENAFMNGHGANQPLGLFTASSDGISTGRDVSTGNTNTAMTATGLINARYELKGGYWARARWLFHRDALKQIRTLQTSDGDFIWQPSFQAGQPETILGVPFIMSEFAPNTFTTGLYVGMIADFSYYWIADALSMQVQRLIELYAESNQVGYIGRLETDGMPVLEEAFVRVTLT